MSDCEPIRISRREALRWVLAAGGGAALLGPMSFAAGPARPYGRDAVLTDVYAPGDLWPLTLNPAQRRTVTALCDLIIPADPQSPAASALGVPAFIDEWISAPYDVQQAQRQVILDGLQWLDDESGRRFNATFAAVSDAQRSQIADDICSPASAQPQFHAAAQFFDLMRSLTATGFYTTPVGWKDVGFVGNVPLGAFPPAPPELLQKLGLAGEAAAGADINTLTPAEQAAGWNLLFDGNTLNGWRGYAREDVPPSWRVEDGCLKNEAGRDGGDLVTKEHYDNFDLKFDWRISPGGNSGVKYEVKEGKTGKSGVGFEYQILDDDKNSDSLNGPQRQAGALYYLIAPNGQKRLEPVGNFNSSEIRVRGDHVEHWLNGAKIVEFEIGSPELKAAIAASKFKKISWYGQKRPTVILLQDHGDMVWFRNLKIRPL